MPSFAEIANRIYRKVLGVDGTVGEDKNSISVLLDGATAVATVEAILSEAAASGETFPPERGSSAWRSEQQRQQVNLFGKPLLQMESNTPRGSLSAAMGLAMAGRRAFCSLWSSDLAASQDLVRRAVGRHLPLVIHTINRALPLNGESLGGSDEGIHQLTNSGAFILFAENGQQAVDFTLIARAVAERALVPAIVVMDGDETAFASQQIDLPSPELIEKLIGNSSDPISIADPAQQLLFGDERRRVPGWYSLDHPTLQGSYRDRHSFGTGAVSHTTFFGKQVKGILHEIFGEFADLTGRNYSSLNYHGKKGARKIVITQGAITGRCRTIVDLLQKREKISIAVVGIGTTAPFPAAELGEILQNCQEITLFDRSEPLLNELPPLYSQVAPLIPANCRSASIIYGVGGTPVNDADLIAACMAPHNRSAGEVPVYRMGITTLADNSNPKQQVLRDLLERNYPQLAELGIREEDSAAEESPATPSVLRASAGGETPTHRTPMAVRHLGKQGGVGHAGYHNLSRFWDQTGLLYRDGMESRQGVDPFAAAAHIPPLTSTFSSVGDGSIPFFNPENCSGCGSCWSNCPDSAIGAVSILPSKLLESALQMGGADALRPHLSELSREISLTTESGEAGTIIRKSWDTIMEQSPLSEERRASAEDAITTLISNIGALPVAHTEPLFHQPERLKAQSGELLSVVINPDSCKGCGICTRLCQDESNRQEIENPALTMMEQDSKDRENSYHTWSIWEQLPDSASTTLVNYGTYPDIGQLNATMLSRYASMTMAGGDSAEPGSGEKIVVRQLLGITEYHQQPLVRQLLKEMDEKQSGLVAGIREKLATASHADDLSLLAEGLGNLSSRQLDLTTLAEKTAGIEGDSVDAHELKEWVELAESIRIEKEKIEKGEHSLGRARYSLAFASGTAATWAGTFPYNPFQVPVVIGEAGEIGALASGLMEGQLEQTTEVHRLLRKAKALLKGRLPAERKEIDKTTWGDLTADELQQCPPMLLIGNDTTLGAGSAGELNWILNSRLPIKIIVLAEMDLGFSEAHADSRSELAMAALSQRGAYVAQCSIAAPEQMNRAMREALNYPGPALLRLHAPSPQRHGFGPEMTTVQAERAVNGRAFPLFSYNPEATGVFGTRISLGGNPESEISIAEWAFHEGRFSGQFQPLSPALQSQSANLEEWLKLDERGQNNKTPIFNEYAIEPDFARRLGQLVEQWQMLQELAGIVTPFTEDVREQADKAIAESHQREIDELKKGHQQEINNLRNQLESEITQRITERLVALTETQKKPN